MKPNTHATEILPKSLFQVESFDDRPLRNVDPVATNFCYCNSVKFSRFFEDALFFPKSDQTDCLSRQSSSIFSIFRIILNSVSAHSADGYSINRLIFPLQLPSAVQRNPISFLETWTTIIRPERIDIFSGS